MRAGFFNTGFPRISLVFLLIISVVILNVAFNFFLIQKNKATINKMTEVINPYLEGLEDFNEMLIESKMYSTNWVYLQNNIEDKKSLEDLHKKRYPQMKEWLSSFIVKFKETEGLGGLKADSLMGVFHNFENLIIVEKEIMSTLSSFDNYENPKMKFIGEDLVESEVLPRTEQMIKQLSVIMKENKEEAVRMKKEIESESDLMSNIMLVSSIGLLVFIVISVAFISGNIRKPVQKMNQIVQQLAKGEIPDDKIEIQKNVIGDMVVSVHALTDSFKQTSEFANEIGKGNLSAEYNKLGENDVLGNALIHMRESLKAYAHDMEQKVSDRTFEVIEKSKKLEHAYKEIRDSINYAKRIQESILPANEMITEAFPQSFVYYKPKDVVCGDFYWFGRRGDEAVIAAVDCTGHGVPGALMTVIGNSLLNQIVNSSGITSPSVILTQLDIKLHETLKQHGNIITNDGMDAAVCRYRISKNELVFSGAKRPVYVFKKGELLEIKGDKSPIGSFVYESSKRFTEHKIPVSKGDTIYLFTDGLQDQFGGENGKKFMIKRFREMLEGMQDLSMKDQHSLVEREMDDWKRQYEQTDDMLLVGIRF